MQKNKCKSKSWFNKIFARKKNNLKTRPPSDDDIPEKTAEAITYTSNDKSDAFKTDKDVEKVAPILQNDADYSEIVSESSTLPYKACDSEHGVSIVIPSEYSNVCQDYHNGDINASFNNIALDKKMNLLSIPMNDKCSKMSDDDSAVDMRFNDDPNDSGDSSRCTSSSAIVTNGLGVEKAEKPKIGLLSTEVKRTDSSSSWRKIRAALVWTPFIQYYAKHRYPWIQIAGHPGNFKPGEHGTILKKHSDRESICLQMMSEDNLSDFVPSFKGDVNYEGEKYICMQDLLAQFNMPSLMDVKMGTRTYLEEELGKSHCSPRPRQDMYEKMIEVDKEEPTEEEHRLKAVVKSRYMQWRENLSSTLTLGFRIEGIKKSPNKNNKNVGTQSRNFKRTKCRMEVKEALKDFVDSIPDLLRKFIERLKSLKRNLERSNFFWSHEFVGSSLLFVHDRNGKANIWMIDFGKTVPLPPKCKVDHSTAWVEGNHEDGYFFGLDNLLMILEELNSELSHDSS